LNSALFSSINRPHATRRKTKIIKKSDIDLIEQKTFFQGYFRVDQYKLRHKKFEGGMTDTMTREIFERGHSSIVLLYDPDLDKVVLIEQFRMGAFAATASTWFSDDYSPWLIEAVAGIIEDGETPEDVARREVVEEAGCELLDLLPINQFFISQGGSSESCFTFFGRVDSTKAGGDHGIKQEHEDILVFVADADEAFNWAKTGKVVYMVLANVLQWLQINRDDVRANWS
jgi:ADP-ribose pyrophosphatase